MQEWSGTDDHHMAAMTFFGHRTIVRWIIWGDERSSVVVAAACRHRLSTSIRLPPAKRRGRVIGVACMVRSTRPTWQSRTDGTIGDINQSDDEPVGRVSSPPGSVLPRESKKSIERAADSSIVWAAKI